jgi:hypothetical protein
MYVNRQDARDGFIPAPMLPMLYPFKSPKKLAQRLVEAGLWDEQQGGYRVHDYHSWNSSREKIEEQKSNARQRAARCYDRKKNFNSTPADSTQSTHAEQPQIEREKRVSAKEWSGSSPDPDLRSLEKTLGTLGSERESPRATNLAAALELPIAERCAALLRDEHLAQWLEPHMWPELVELAAQWQAVTGNRTKLGAWQRDSGLRALVGLLGDGVELERLHAAIDRVKGDAWLKGKSLGALTHEVLRRLESSGGGLDVLKGPGGATLHLQRGVTEAEVRAWCSPDSDFGDEPAVEVSP